MASIRQSIRSSTASKRPTSAIADGQIALNTASGTPGMFFKDNAGNIIKAGPAHYGATAPNSSPAVGGSTGNSLGEAWLDSSLTPAGWKVWNGAAWVNATPLSSDTVQGLVELATNAETQAGVDSARAVTAASLQSKVSDSVSTASASGIASSTAVKTAYDLANAALPKSGGIITGNLEIGTTGSLTFEGSTADGFETTLAVVDPTLDRTITFPNITGTVVTTGDTGTVTGTMIADNTIVNAEINSSAAIAFSKLASLASANILVGNASGVPTAAAVTGDVTITNAGVTAIASNVIVNADINTAAAIAYSKLALSSGITNTDINASAAIAGTKISPNFGSQNIQTSGTLTVASGVFNLGTAAAPSITISGAGIYSPGAGQLAISTGGTGRITVDGSGNVNIDSNTLYVDAVNNRVGIGTTEPAYALDVRTTGTSISSSFTSDQSEQYIALKDSGTTLGHVRLGSTSGSMLFFAGNGERARIDSSGRLLVGTSSWSVGATAAFVGNSSSGAGNADVYFSRGLAATGLSSGQDVSVISFSDNAGEKFATIGAQVDGTPGASDYPGRLVFSTTADGAASPTERMRIDNAGRVAINATPTVQQFFVEHNGRDGIAITDANASSVQANLLFSNTRAGGTSNYYVLGYANSVNTFLVYSNGNVQNTNNSYGAISDIKLKENIVDANSQWDDLKALKVRNYNLKEGQTHTQIGLVAQEAELVSPGLVTESPDRDAEGNDLGTVTKSINYSVLYMKAVKALQEAMERIETLEARLTAAGVPWGNAVS